ncbi:hypothetical protein ABZY57_01175 [Streptomyces sp. NPDC006450]|uniref:hypothetical protein n=1 Tax=Streptomyces sp. NPDC006450 TaxID=3155458 RepID=UPI0033BFAF9E
MPETDPHRTSATPELLTLLTGADTAPVPAPTALQALPAVPAVPAVPATGRLRPPADGEQQLRRRSDVLERLTDGIVELRKRRQIAASPEVRSPGAEAPW